MHFTTENEELLLMIVNKFEGDDLLRFNKLLLDETDGYVKEYIKETLIDFFNWYQDDEKEMSNNETIVDAYLYEINLKN